MGRIGLGLVVEASLRYAYPATLEEGVNRFEPRGAVDEGAIVRMPIERDEVPTRPLGHAQQEVVEDLSPGPSVQRTAVRKDAVEIEQARANAGRKAEHAVRHRDRWEPRRRLTPEVGEDREVDCCLLAFARDPTPLSGELGRGE